MEFDHIMGFKGVAHPTKEEEIIPCMRAYIAGCLEHLEKRDCDQVDKQEVMWFMNSILSLSKVETGYIFAPHHPMCDMPGFKISHGNVLLGKSQQAQPFYTSQSIIGKVFNSKDAMISVDESENNAVMSCAVDSKNIIKGTVKGTIRRGIELWYYTFKDDVAEIKCVSKLSDNSSLDVISGTFDYNLNVMSFKCSKSAIEGVIISIDYEYNFESKSSDMSFFKTKALLDQVLNNTNKAE